MTTSTQAVARALAPAIHSAPASQATRVEQSRAMAEVQAMVVVARQAPRDETRAIGKAVDACRMMAVAERAFFKFPRGGQTVSGPSIHLAVELARCWGNITYGLSELDRDDMRGQSEMVAFAWDLETNARASTTFIVPHKRDKKGGAEVLTELRDIYENNANMGARRLREMIFRVLPPYLVEMGKDACRESLEGGGGEPMAARVAKCLKLFADIGISRERLEAKIGAVADKWTPVDIANLGVSFQSIRRGEIDASEEFPTTGATTVAAALKPEPAPHDAETGEIIDHSSAGSPVGEEAGTGGVEAAASATILPAETVPATPTPPAAVVPPMIGSKIDWPALSMAVQQAILDAPDLPTIEAIRAANRDALNKMFKANQEAYRAIVNTVNARKAELTGTDRA